MVVKGHQKSTEQKVLCGVPQGSILGPFLFIIYMTDMSNLPLTSKLLLFADDTVLYYSDKCRENLYSTVQSDLDMVVNWCSFNKLCIQKTKATFFDKSFPRSCVSNLSLYISGDTVKKR